MNTDYCYECDRETEWDADEVCSGCGRTWGHPAYHARKRTATTRTEDAA